ncbi:hypothetical protein EDC01DRAFT_426750 [Geopyxis carbonaria]|nr:hypothetical protein EDC01DRAFT_426750 [Geopyxis carbonaria]
MSELVPPCPEQQKTAEYRQNLHMWYYRHRESAVAGVDNPHIDPRAYGSSDDSCNGVHNDVLAVLQAFNFSAGPTSLLFYYAIYTHISRQLHCIGGHIDLRRRRESTVVGFENSPSPTSSVHYGRRAVMWHLSMSIGRSVRVAFDDYNLRKSDALVLTPGHYSIRDKSQM